MILQDDGSRQLRVKFAEDDPWLLVIASSETSGVHKGAKLSRTWNFLDPDGKAIRVQIQKPYERLTPEKEQ